MTNPGKSNLKIIAADYVEGNKRQHMPFLLQCACDNCGGELEQDLSDDHYLSYPSLGNATNPAPMERIIMYCTECDHEQAYRVRVMVALEVVS